MKILLPISSLCVALLVTAAMFTSCQKEAQLVPAIATEQVVDNNATTDRNAPDVLGFSYVSTHAADVQYRVTNANGSTVYFTHSFSANAGKVVIPVPSVNDCPKIQMRARKLPNPPGGINKLNYIAHRDGCDAVYGNYSVNATSSTPWSSIPWVTIQESACCL
jgi:hypothetical protein